MKELKAAIIQGLKDAITAKDAGMVSFLSNALYVVNMSYFEQDILNVTPVPNETDQANYEKLGEIRGFLQQYKDLNIGVENIMNYLDKLINPQA
jgi:hypothetical protein